MNKYLKEIWIIDADKYNVYRMIFIDTLLITHIWIIYFKEIWIINVDKDNQDSLPYDDI